jgi:hypothetical protein
MLDAQEDVFYYVTVMNENYAHPALPAGTEEGILRGMYPLRARERAQVQLLGSGTILREVIAAADALEREHGIAANVWSVTSWTELRWDGMACERAMRLGGGAPTAWIGRSSARTCRKEGPTWPSAPTGSAAATRARTCGRSSRWIDRRSCKPRSRRSGSGRGPRNASASHPGYADALPRPHCGMCRPSMCADAP